MNHGDLTAKVAPSLESVHEVKLEALLHDLLRKEGRLGAARMLGVNYKTIARSIDSGRMSVHLREALMTRLLEQGGLDADQSEDGGTPGRTVEEFLEDLGEVRNELVQRLTELEGRISLVEGGPRSPAAEEPSDDVAERSQGKRAQEAAADGKSQPSGSPARPIFRTTSPSVITMEPQPGDEEVFGDAWHLVDEWRQLRERHPFQGKGVAWLKDEERLRELEIALVGEHGLTMSPDTNPWDSLSRRTQVRWRTQTLERVHKERVLAQIRRWIRRILTLGVWRN